MERDKILAIVANSICDETEHVNVDAIVKSTTARDIPGWDSLAHVRIMLGIEMELDITVPIDSTYKADTVGELVDLIEHVISNN